MRMRYFLAAALLASGGASAQVYKCPDAAGRTVLQQTPCAGGAEPVALNKVRSRFPTATTAVFALGAGDPPVLEHLFYASENGGTGGE